MIRAICKLLTIIVGLGWTPGASAMMLEAQDYFRSVTEQEFSQIRSALKQIPNIDAARTRILTLDEDFYPHLSYKVFVVRLENLCSNSRCFSAVFKDKIGTEYFQGLTSLPAKMAVADVRGPVCDGCQTSVGYIFQAPNGGSKAIVLTEFGPMF